MTIRHVCALLMLVAAPALGVEKDGSVSQTFPSHPGKVVLVDSGPLDLDVRSAEIPEIRVNVNLVAAALSESAANAWLDAHRPTLQDGEDTLHITAPDPSGISLLKGVIVTRARIEIVLPSNVQPDLSSTSGTVQVGGEYPAGKPLRLRTATGEIDFDGWSPEIEARSTSGDIQLRATRAVDNLLARTATGAISLVGGARTVRCDGSGGDVRLEGLLGPLSVVTTSGNVTAKFDALAAGDAVHITTSSGRVRVTLPPGAKPGGEVSSARGEIRSIYPGESAAKGGHLQLAGNGVRLTITTTSGRIDLL